MGKAEASSAIDRATSRVKKLTIGQPTEAASGPALKRPKENNVRQPLKIEIIVNLMAIAMLWAAFQGVSEQRRAPLRGKSDSQSCSAEPSQ